MPQWRTVPQNFIAELVAAHPDLALAPTISETSKTRIELESQPVTDLESPVLFYSVENADFQRFESALAGDHTVTGWQVAIDFNGCRVYQIQLSSAVQFLTPAMTELGVNVLAAESAERGWRIRVHASDKGQLGAFWEYCREEGIDFHLEKIYSSGSNSQQRESEGIRAELTDRQREVARTVTKMGYYRQEGATAEEVAAELGISPSTLSTHLRRIIAKIFHLVFED